MLIPDWEVMCRETLSLAETNRTVPRLSVTSERAAAEVAVASPSMTKRMLALSTGATVYCFTEAGTCRRDGTEQGENVSEGNSTRNDQ